MHIYNFNCVYFGSECSLRQMLLKTKDFLCRFIFLSDFSNLQLILLRMKLRKKLFKVHFKRNMVQVFDLGIGMGIK